MVLSIEDRGFLEQFIDQAIKEIPQLIPLYREPKVKSMLHLQTVEDYALGQMNGYVIGSLVASFVYRNLRKPTQEEMQEIMNIINKRIGEFREAIFKQG